MNNLTQIEKLDLLETYNKEWLCEQLSLSSSEFMTLWRTDSFSVAQVNLLRSLI